MYFSFGFYLATFKIQIFEEDKERAHPFYYDYRGVSHVVTSFSKGSATPAEILLQGANAKLNYLFFTDLNIMDRPYNVSGYQGNVFTFSNQKISYLDSHILIYSKNAEFYFNSMSQAHAQLHQHFSEQKSKEKSYLAVLAHPFKKHHQWTGEFPVGLDGIEVINMRHLWQKTWMENKATFFLSILTYPFNPQMALLRLIERPSKEIELWDHLTKVRQTLGFLGNETTAKIFNILGLNFTFPSYTKSFEFASNHILLASELTGYVESDREKIFGAIENGHFYFAFDSLGPPRGFASYMRQKDQRFLMGSKLSWSENLKLYIDLPYGLQVPYKIEVYRNGTLYFQSTEMKEAIQVKEPGRYRIEVKIKPDLPFPDSERWFGWIYTNPFYVN